jgi:O-acetyl-ADP-ribose deacetylase (regulator of RNase III)
MCEIVDGDIVASDVQALVNPVNTAGVMGKGLAWQFKQAFPAMFEDYRRACRHGEVAIGRMHVYDRGEQFRPRYIVNFPTKRHWRDRSRLDDIHAGLEALVREVRSRGIGSIAIPPLGCGLGGLSWPDVYPMIVAGFQELPEVRTLVFAPLASPHGHAAREGELLSQD